MVPLRGCPSSYRLLQVVKIIPLESLGLGEQCTRDPSAAPGQRALDADLHRVIVQDVVRGQLVPNGPILEYPRRKFALIGSLRKRLSGFASLGRDVVRRS